MTVKLTVIGKIVLGAGHGLDVIGVTAHKTAHESAAHCGSQERVLTVALTRTSPTRVTYRLHYRTPESKAFGSSLEYGAGLIGYDRCLQRHEFRFPAGTKGHTTRE